MLAPALIIAYIRYVLLVLFFKANRHLRWLLDHGRLAFGDFVWLLNIVLFILDSTHDCTMLFEERSDCFSIETRDAEFMKISGGGVVNSKGGDIRFDDFFSSGIGFRSLGSVGNENNVSEHAGHPVPVHDIFS